MNKLWLLLSTLLVVPAHAQNIRTGDLVAHLDSLISIMPTELDANLSTLPSTSGAEKWSGAVSAILDGQFGLADTLASVIDYSVVLWTDGEQQHVILERNISRDGPYWGTFVHPINPLRPHLMVQAPHPIRDSNTGYQSVRVYSAALPGGLIFSGTTRCDNSSYSTCDGTTSICSGSSEAYRISDQAHISSGTFQLTTAAYLEYDPELVVLQPHGFGRTETDPHLILSNGTTNSPSGADWALALRDAIVAERDTMTFKVGHLDEWDRLLGTTNTQGRLLNGSGNPCDDAASTASGQFIHLEQSYDDLRDDETGWSVLANAVVNAFEPVVSTVRGQAEQPRRFSFESVTPNPFNATVEISLSLDRAANVALEVWNLEGRRVATLVSGDVHAGSQRLSWSPRALASGSYLLRLTTPEGTRLRRVTYLK